MKKFSILLFLTFTLIGFSQKLKSSTTLQSGPMVGYCEMTEAMIWLQTTNLATVKIEYFAIDNPAVIFTSDNYSTTKDVGYTYHVILDKLQQGKTIFLLSIKTLYLYFLPCCSLSKII